MKNQSFHLSGKWYIRSSTIHQVNEASLCHTKRVGLHHYQLYWWHSYLQQYTNRMLWLLTKYSAAFLGNLVSLSMKEKLILLPTKHTEYLGNVMDFKNMTITLPEHRIQKILYRCTADTEKERENQGSGQSNCSSGFCNSNSGNGKAVLQEDGNCKNSCFTKTTVTLTSRCQSQRTWKLT